MKNFSLKKLLFKGMVLLAFAFILLIGFILNPSLSYAHQSEIEGINVFHDDPLSPEISQIIRESNRFLISSPLDNPTNSQLCLNEGIYPKVIQALMGPDVIRAFRNINVVLGERTEGNRLKSRSHSFGFTQFLAHARVHNQQYAHHGFWDANPLGGHPEWKWEGFADYVVLGDTYSLKEIWDAYKSYPNDPYIFVELEEGAGSLKLHIRYLLLVKYCLDEKNMQYQSFMDNALKEEVLWQELEDKFSQE